ncbi:hypothetical protein [Chryseobacterium wanjuense]
MEKKLPLLFFILLFCLPKQLLSQTYQLSGNPVNTTGWTMVGLYCGKWRFCTAYPGRE